MESILVCSEDSIDEESIYSGDTVLQAWQRQ